MIGSAISMTFGHTRVLAAAALAALMFLRAEPLATERAAHAALPADAFARAVASRDAVLFDLCVTDHLDVNAPGPNGRTPLLVAAQQRDRTAIEQLLTLGAKVDVPDADGFTPLMVAAVGDDLDLLQLFLARSENPQAKDAAGRSAAAHAILARRYEALNALLESDADPSVVKELLPLACDIGDATVMQAIVSRLPANLAWTKDTRAALSIALRTRNDVLARTLLSKHSAPPTADASNAPLLAQAIVDDDLGTCQTLLAAGADPNTILPLPLDKAFLTQLPGNLRDYAKVDPGMTVLMVAAGMGKAEFVRTLIDAGAERNRLTSHHKMLALYFAAQTRKWKCTQMLLGSGPTPEQLRIEISLQTQRAAVLKDGTPIFETQCSTGREGFATQPGQYVITDKQRSHISSIYKVEMPYFMRLNCLDFGMHEGVVPRYPASHGCIRLPAAAVRKLFFEIPVGTVVMIN